MAKQQSFQRVVCAYLSTPFIFSCRIKVSTVSVLYSGSKNRTTALHVTEPSNGRKKSLYLFIHLCPFSSLTINNRIEVSALTLIVSKQLLCLGWILSSGYTDLKCMSVLAFLKIVMFFASNLSTTNV